MFGDIWFLIKQSVSAFIDDEALTRGAAIAFLLAAARIRA